MMGFIRKRTKPKRIAEAALAMRRADANICAAIRSGIFTPACEQGYRLRLAWVRDLSERLDRYIIDDLEMCPDCFWKLLDGRCERCKRRPARQHEDTHDG